MNYLPIKTRLARKWSGPVIYNFNSLRHKQSLFHCKHWQMCKPLRTGYDQKKRSKKPLFSKVEKQWGEEKKQNKPTVQNLPHTHTKIVKPKVKAFSFFISNSISCELISASWNSVPSHPLHPDCCSFTLQHNLTTTELVSKDINLYPFLSIPQSDMSHNVIPVQRFILRDIISFSSGGERPAECVSFTHPHVILYDFWRKRRYFKHICLFVFYIVQLVYYMSLQEEWAFFWDKKRV